MSLEESATPSGPEPQVLDGPQAYTPEPFGPRLVLRWIVAAVVGAALSFASLVVIAEPVGYLEGGSFVPLREVFSDCTQQGGCPTGPTQWTRLADHTGPLFVVVFLTLLMVWGLLVVGCMAGTALIVHAIAHGGFRASRAAFRAGEQARQRTSLEEWRTRHARALAALDAAPGLIGLDDVFLIGRLAAESPEDVKQRCSTALVDRLCAPPVPRPGTPVAATTDTSTTSRTPAYDAVYAEAYDGDQEVRSRIEWELEHSWLLWNPPEISDYD